ncbi:MAG: YfiR family protein [Bacteroidales bacterium]|nr:YfiR family protein [Bacteroidales bacterium]MBN2763319.1 YfiR family protein [Bacteroidales bacterium]
MKKLLLLFFILTMKAGVSYSQMGIPKAQAMFIFNFSRLIEWPASYRNGPFIIGVLGTSAVADELDLYTKGKKVGTQVIQVARFKTPAEISSCHILFVPFARSKQLAEISSALQGKSTLIITEKNGALNDGSAINFVILENKLKFELKAENASKLGIKLSSKLEEMALSGA